jgi:hypothetical protein
LGLAIKNKIETFIPMNKFVSLIIFSLCGLAAYCQQQPQKSHFDILVGPSIPLGKLAKKDGDTRNAGFAKTGEYLKVSAVKSINNKFSFGAFIQVQRNPVSTSALENFASKLNAPTLVFGTGFPPLPPPPPSGPEDTFKNWHFNKSAWTSTSLLIGVIRDLEFKQHPQLSAFAGVYVGGVYCWSPKIHGESTSDTANAKFTQSSSSGIGFAYSATTGLKYSLNTKTKLVFNVDYFGTTNINFSGVKSNLNASRTGIFGGGGLPSAWGWQRTADAKQAIQSINIGLGISFLL